MGRRTIVMLVVIAMVLGSFGGPWAGVDVTSEIGRTNTVAPVIEPMPEVEQLLEGVGEHFVENQGQVENAAVRYYAHGDELSVGFMDSGMIYTLRGQGLDRGSGSDTFSGNDPVALMCWYEGANDVEPRGVDPQDSSSNFFRGSDPSQWVRHASSFSEVRYDDLYDGVDLRFYFMDGKLKYDLILDAGADPDRIVFRYDGVEGLGIDPASGDLLIHTSAGLLRDTRPVVFQGTEDRSNGIGAGFEIISDTSCRFMIPTTIDPNMPMVIDPGLEFSTFFGGNGGDNIYDVKVDGAGDLYLIGWTSSPDFPTTPGAYCAIYGGSRDISVTKLSANGTKLIYSTYIGGAGLDRPYESILTSDGVLYIAGHTRSDDFPLTDDAIRKNYSGREGILLKLSADGSSLLYSTYIGGYWSETVYFLEMDDAGSIYLGGETNSSDLPVSLGAFCTTFVPSGTSDRQLFLMKLDSTMGQIQYCTYIGGNNSDNLGDMHLDDDDNLLLIGFTQSMDFPTTPGAFDEVKNGTTNDLFVLKLNAQGTSLLYSTFIGGDGFEGFSTMEVLDDGSLYIAGLTKSKGFPITQGAYDTSLDGSSFDAFLLKLNNDGSDIVYSTFLGGDGFESISSIRLAKDGKLNIFGTTESTDFPTTPDAINATKSGDGKDVFFAIMDERLSSLEFSTFFGGTGPLQAGSVIDGWISEDFFYILGTTSSTELPTTFGCFDQVFRGESDICIVGVNLTKKTIEYCSYLGGGESDYPVFITADSRGHLIVVGTTFSSNFPVTSGAFQSTHGGGKDLFVARIDPVPCDPPYRPVNLTATAQEGWVLLDWDPPVLRNGMVSSHRIYRGTSVDNIAYYDEIGYFDRYNVTYYDSDVINGTKYYYKLSAVNSRGEGELTIIPVVAMPFGPPTPPLDFIARTGNGKVTLTWESPETTGGFPLMGYEIFRGATRETLETIETVDPDVTTWVDDSVEIGDFYYYAIIAYSVYGPSPRSEAVRMKVTDVPSMPPGFNVVAEDGKVTLTWGYPTENGGSMIVGFYVWRMTGTGSMEVIATLDPSRLSFTDTNVTNGRSYTYMVSAFSEVGESRSTEAVDAIPFGEPGEVIEFKATPGAGNVTLEWDPPLDDGGARLKGYILYWGTESGNLDQQQVMGNTTSFTLRGLDNGVTHYFQIVAENKAGLGPVSIVVHAIPMGPPGTVRDLVPEATPAGIKLTWTVPSDTGGATTITYRILRGTTDDPLNVVGEVVNEFENVDDTATSGTTYYYRILAVTAIGEGPLMEPVMVTAGGVPAQVTDVTITTGNNMVTLTWTAPDDGGSPITQYVILRGIFETGLAEIGRVEGTVLTYSDDTAENGKSYFYKVYALNAIGGGAQSESISATPRGPPPAPGVLEAKVKGDNIVLTWTAPTAGNTASVTGYKIYRGDSELELVLLEEVGNVNSYTDDDVKANKPYYYKVLATSDSGDGDMSRLADAKVKTDDGPGFGGIVGILALGTVITLISLTRRKR